MKPTIILSILLLTLTLTLALATSASARIGESRAMCRKRYGKPLGTQQQGQRETALYKTGSFMVNILFWDGTAYSITYQKLSDDDGAPVALTEAQMKKLLTINFGDQDWQGSADLGGWFTRDLRCGGHIDRETVTYTVMDMITSRRVGNEMIAGWKHARAGREE